MQTKLCLNCIRQVGNSDGVVRYTFIYKKYFKKSYKHFCTFSKELGAILFLFLKYWLVEDVIIRIANVNYMDLVSNGNEVQQT